MTSQQKLLEALGPPGSFTYVRFLEAIYETAYTGPFTVHCLNGTPQQIDLGGHLAIVEGLDRRREPQRR